MADWEPDRKWHKIYAARVLAERKATEAVPALLELVNDNHLALRVESALALSRLDAERGRVILRQILQDPSVVKESYFRTMEVAAALADLGDASGYDFVNRGLTLKDWESGAIIFLPGFAKLGIDVLPQLLNALEKAAQDLQRAQRGARLRFDWALIGLEKVGDERALPKLQEIAQRMSPEFRFLVEKTIRQIHLSNVNNLIDVLRSDPEKSMRAYAAWRLGERGEKRAIPDLIKVLDDEQLELRLEAALALVRLGDERGRAWLQAFFKNSPSGESTVAIYIAGALAELGDASGVQFIERVIEQGPWPRRYDAIKVLPAFKQAQVDLVPHLLRALDLAQKDTRSEDKEAVRWAKGGIQLGLDYLQQVGDARALPKAKELSHSDDPEIRSTAEKTLRQLRKQAGDQ
jgi:HEAT repeat protein